MTYDYADRTTSRARDAVRALRRAAGDAAGSGTLLIGVPVQRVRRVLWVAAALIVVLDWLASLGAGLGAPYNITRFFDGDYKVNFPTGYKLAFLLATTLLFAAHRLVGRRSGDRFTPAWLLLTFVGAFALLDETVYLHQTLSDVLHNRFDTSGPLKFAWTIVYVPVALAVFVILLRYVRYLAPSLLWPLFLGGGLYGAGAVLLEPLKSHFSDTLGEQSLQLKLSAAASDSLQMVGLTVLVVVLLTELSRRVGAVVLTLDDEPTPEAIPSVTLPRS